MRYENTDSVVLLSRTSGVGDGHDTTQVVLFSGLADFQANGAGLVFIDPSGVQRTSEATLAIDPDSVTGALPSVVLLNDGSTFVVQYGGIEYDVILATESHADPRHLKLHLKRGKQSYSGQT